LAPPVSGASFLLGVRRSLEMANRQLRIEASAGRRDRVIASTVVCLLFFERWFCCLWVGDSRLYRVRDGRIAHMTRDHSEVQLLVDHGAVSARRPGGIRAPISSPARSAPRVDRRSGTPSRA
jgi:serine/threonine protein phosphatase PrpC